MYLLWIYRPAGLPVLTLTRERRCCRQGGEADPSAAPPAAGGSADGGALDPAAADAEPEFPVAELARLEEMISRPRWVIPVLPGGELEVLLNAAIDLCKQGEYRTPNTEHRTPSTEYRAPNTEH